MAEVYVNSVPVIRNKVYWRGVPTDADSLPTVKVYDVTEDPAVAPAILPTTLLTTITSVKSETDPGTYEIYLPQLYTNRNRSLRLVWESPVMSDVITNIHKVFVTTPYADISQAADAIGVSSDQSDPNYKSYDELSAAERWARKVIESYTGQEFFLYDDVYMIYGTGSDTLPLPYKIDELHELYQNDILLVDTINEIDNWNYPVQISESGFGLRVNRAGMLDNTVYTANGMVPPTINDNYNGAFSNGSAYRVQGRFGWDSVPDEIELACIELMKDYFSNDKNWRNKYIKNIQTFDWNFEYNSDTFSGTGNAYVDQLLDAYVLTQMVVI
jgi:hypothetical protein